MKRFSTVTLILGLFFTGCSDKSAPTASNDNQTQAQEVTLGPIGSHVLVTAPPTLPDPTATVSASVDTIFQSAGSLQTVTFTGSVNNSLTALYTLTDEYGIISFTGSLSNGTFSVALDLPAIVDSGDTNGRQYVFNVIALNPTTFASASDTVIVAYVAPSTGGGSGNGNHDCDSDHNGHDNDGHGKNGDSDKDHNTVDNDHGGKNGKGNDNDHGGKNDKGNDNDHGGKNDKENNKDGKRH